MFQSPPLQISVLLRLDEMMRSKLWTDNYLESMTKLLLSRKRNCCCFFRPFCQIAFHESILSLPSFLRARCFGTIPEWNAFFWELMRIPFIVLQIAESTEWKKYSSLRIERIIQGPKLRPTGRQCDWKLNRDERSFHASHQLATDMKHEPPFIQNAVIRAFDSRNV